MFPEESAFCQKCKLVFYENVPKVCPGLSLAVAVVGV